jgi:hypothetical protein
MTLNLAQDLAADFDTFAASWFYGLLIELISRPETLIAERALTAIKWFNTANAIDVGDEIALLNLSVAFETLLALPKDQKTERFTDTISLLLGRVPRLHVWAGQFYDARCAIVHQGTADNLHFVATDSKKLPDKPALYGSLLSYGRQIFQLCMSTVLFGAKFAEKAGLQGRLVTNQERFEQICGIFNDGKLTATEKLAKIAEIVALLNRYKFSWESNLSTDTMISSGQSAARALLDCDTDMESVLKEAFNKFVNAKKSSGWYDALDAVQEINRVSTQQPDGGLPRATTLQLLKVLWHYLCMDYFWLQRSREPKAKSEAEASD